MQILITRGTVVRPNDGPARAVEPGDVVDVDKVQAAQLIGLGKATLVVDAPKPETASYAPAETAVLPTAAVKRRGK